MRRHPLLAAILAVGCGGPNLYASAVCEDGDQSCDCLGDCAWDNKIHECIDGEWQDVVLCSGTQTCIEEPGELPTCA